MSNDKLMKKVAQVKSSNRTDATMFSSMLSMKRKQMKHRGIIPINPGDREWGMIKEICALATEFCNEFNLDLKKGYDRYITLAIQKMKNYSLNKFKYLHPSIVKEFESILEIELDDRPEKTQEIENIYLATIANRTGFSKSYKQDNPDKYVFFIRARKEAEKFNVSYKAYIASQFSWFEMMNSTPDPAQLVGTKSLERLQKYCYEHNIKMGQAAKPKVINWQKIKDAKNNPE